jgi:sigma-E factor negative regulatory protein RseA
VVMLTRLPGPAAAPPLALANPAPATVRPVAAPPLVDTMVAEPAPSPVPRGMYIRDARLERYLDAHQQFAGSSALGVPSAFLRSATTAAPSER